MTQIIKLLLMTVAVLVAAQILPGIQVDSYMTALVVAVVLGVLNAFVKPILVFLTLPITLVTMGLFLLVINVSLVMFTAYLVPGLTVASWLWALAFSIVLWLISWFFETVVRA